MCEKTKLFEISHFSAGGNKKMMKQQQQQLQLALREDSISNEFQMHKNHFWCVYD